jgi:hypothetical protein
LNSPKIENKKLFFLEGDPDIVTTTGAYNKIYKSKPENPKSKYIEITDRHGDVGESGSIKVGGMDLFINQY